MFAENIRDGFHFDPIEVEPVPDKPGWYRLLVLQDGSDNQDSDFSSKEPETAQRFF